jgi:formaldehyde-activating enzyme involved in methanogenesis
VDAYVEGGVATWDGAEHDIGGERSAIAADYRDTFERGEIGGRADGVVSAVSLMVAIDGQDGREMYRNFGGLEVLARRVVEIEGEFAVRAEPERVVHALEWVLGPLVGEKMARSRRGRTR